MPAAVPLVGIGVLLVALLAIALAQQINNIMRAVGELVRDVWLVGGVIADGVDAVARGIAYVLGKAEAGVDAAIGASWHLLARYMDKLWQQIEHQAVGYLHLAEFVARLAYSGSGLRAIVHAAQAALHGIEHGIKDLRREWRGIEARVKDLTRDVTKGIGHDLRIGLRDVRKELRGIEHTVTSTIPRAIDYAEGQTASLRDFIKAAPGTNYLAWAGGLVLAGLGVLGLDWLNCKEGKQLGKQRGCGMWSGLDDVLGLFADLVFVSAACDVLPVLDAAVSEVATPLVVAMTDVGAGLCGPESHAAPPLTGPTAPLPNVYFDGNLVLA